MVVFANILRALAVLGPVGVFGYPAPDPDPNGPAPEIYHKKEGDVLIIGGSDGKRRWELQWESDRVCAADVMLRDVMNNDGLPTRMSLEQYMVELASAEPEQRLRMTQHKLKTVMDQVPSHECFERNSRQLNELQPGVYSARIISGVAAGVITPLLYFALTSPATTYLEVTMIGLAYYAATVAGMFAAFIWVGVTVFANPEVESAAQTLDAALAAQIVLWSEMLGDVLRAAAESMQQNRMQCFTAAGLASAMGALSKTDHSQLGITASDKSTARGPKCPNLPIHE